MEDDQHVLEGFLCPICKHDLKTINQLHDHFHQAHSEEEQDVLRTLKGFFGKAKRKILKKENDFEESYRQPIEESEKVFDNTFQIAEHLGFNQECGSFVVHTSTLKKTRDIKIDRYVLETNKLLLRLDRLITDAPEEPEKRKAHERNIVPWIPDSDVRLCPGCAKSFGLPRRRHHCRLCGGVMCQACSKFIDLTFANKLIQPTFHDSHAVSHSAPPTPSQRRDSNTSLLSVMNLAGEPHIRMCKDCHVLLLRRNQQIECRGHRSILVQKYERMKEYIAEVDKLAPLYQKMVDSLCTGETNYHLHDTQEVKLKLSKMAEGVDILSKSIAKLSASEESGSTNAQLQNMIRMSAMQYLRDTVLGAPQLPTEDEVARYRKKREEEIQRKIQLEQEAEAAAAALRVSANETRTKVSPMQEIKSPVQTELGWSASPNNVSVCIEEHPMLQQINNVREYITQARKDNKYDEVRIFEENLKELQMEYNKHMSSML